MSSEGIIALGVRKRSDRCSVQATKNYMTRTEEGGGGVVAMIIQAHIRCGDGKGS